MTASEQSPLAICTYKVPACSFVVCGAELRAIRLNRFTHVSTTHGSNTPIGQPSIAIVNTHHVKSWRSRRVLRHSCLGHLHDWSKLLTSARGEPPSLTHLRANSANPCREKSLRCALRD